MHVAKTIQVKLNERVVAFRDSCRTLMQRPSRPLLITQHACNSSILRLSAGVRARLCARFLRVFPAYPVPRFLTDAPCPDFRGEA